MHRRTFLQCTSLGAAAVALGSRLQAEERPPVQPQTFVYKTVDGLEISADVHRPDDDELRPVVLWIHGGALIVGNRRSVDRRLKRLFLDAGYALVSIDYRLAPESKLPAILEDVQDACRWVRKQGRDLFRGDAEKLVVAGGSAGGYLTLTTGYLAEPRPAALISLWGYGDIAGEWYSRPDGFYREQPLVDAGVAQQAVGNTPLTDGDGGSRHPFYLYCRQQGRWPFAVTGIDPHAQPREYDRFCPVGNVTADYPPTIMIHGTHDTDVPYGQSAIMADALRQRGVAHEMVTVENAGHGLPGVDPSIVEAAYSRIMPFVARFAPMPGVTKG